MVHSNVSENGRGNTAADPLSVRQVLCPRQLRMSPQVFGEICETIGARRAETGGILGGCRQTGEVTHYYFDDSPRQKSSVIYIPDTARLNEVRKKQWKPEDVAYLGSIHSHPSSFRRPSKGDEDSARQILEVLEVPYILVPIVTTLVDTGSVSLYPFAAIMDGGRVRIIEQELVVGGNLISPIREPATSHTTTIQEENAEESMALLMELSITAMKLGNMPWVGMPPMRQRRGGYDRRKRLEYDYD